MIQRAQGCFTSGWVRKGVFSKWRPRQGWGGGEWRGGCGGSKGGAWWSGCSRPHCVSLAWRPVRRASHCRHVNGSPLQQPTCLLFSSTFASRLSLFLSLRVERVLLKRKWSPWSSPLLKLSLCKIYCEMSLL